MAIKKLYQKRKMEKLEGRKPNRQAASCRLIRDMAIDELRQLHKDGEEYVQSVKHRMNDADKQHKIEIKSVLGSF